jgi:phenol hydroxylase P1 protein
MEIDIQSKKIETLRNTYTHTEKRFGDKPATRYQEATFDIQPTENFHYRPTWQPELELYDKRRTAIKMKDWYDLNDPRQFYYGSYVGSRAKLQETADQNFNFVEKRGMLSFMPEEIKQKILSLIIPLRHFEWGANMNNTQICTMGYGTSITAPAMMHAADRLGIAQYITRIGLLLGENEVSFLDQAKQDWLEKEEWQGLRKAVEDSFVLEDWFELFVVQNFVMDGMIHPFFFEHFEQEINQHGGTAQGMLTEFMSAWYGETTRWVDTQLKVAAAESEENSKLISGWVNNWLQVIDEALRPLAQEAMTNGNDVLDQVKADLLKRAEKINLNLK